MTTLFAVSSFLETPSATVHVKVGAGKTAATGQNVAQPGSPYGRYAIKRRSTGLAVAVMGVEAGQVQFVLEGAGGQLPFQINGNEARAGVDGFVAGHVRLQYELHIRHLLFHWVHSRMRLWTYFFYSFVSPHHDHVPPPGRSLVRSS